MFLDLGKQIVNVDTTICFNLKSEKSINVVSKLGNSFFVRYDDDNAKDRFEEIEKKLEDEFIKIKNLLIKIDSINEVKCTENSVKIICNIMISPYYRMFTVKCNDFTESMLIYNLLASDLKVEVI